LLSLIVGNYDVFLTIDQNLRHQQDLTGLRFAVVFASVPDNTMESYQPLLDAMLHAVESAQPGDILFVPER
jgi:hypothetical protein